MPSACTFSAGSKATTSPDRPRAAITETSRRKGTKPSSTLGAPATAAQAAATSPAPFSRTWPLPS